MDKQTEAIKDFVEKFFTNLKCVIKWEDNLMRVSNVPIDFEKFSGKQQPYLLAFEGGDYPEEVELMTKGNYLLKLIFEYTQKKGQTSLLKIIFDVDLAENFNKHFKLQDINFNITKKEQTYSKIIRFIFNSNLQYLNEREQINHSVLIKDSKLYSYDLNKLQTIDGRKEDLVLKDISSELNLAKEELKKLNNNILEKTKIGLKEKLDKEIKRIRAHYDKQRAEHQSSIERLKSQINNLEKDLQKLKDVEQTKIKLEKAKESLDATEKNYLSEKIKSEEEFFINDEINKHNISLNNSLINTTIFYYSKYKIMAFLKTENGGRLIEISYDPLEDIWSEIKCDSCDLPLKQIELCPSGHFFCNSCSTKCLECGKKSCLKCLSNSCEYCKKNVCNLCIKRCNKCNKKVCRKHIVFSEGRNNFCNKCAGFCDFCLKSKDPKEIRKNSEGKNICNACAFNRRA